MSKLDDILYKLEPVIQGKKGLIFDVDGTLLDSMPMWANLDIEYLESLGHKPEPNFHNKVKTMTILDASIYIRDLFNIKKDAEVIAKEITDIAYDYYANKLLVKPGVYELMKYLKEKGYNLVVATANEYDMCEKALIRNDVMKFMDGLVTCSMVGYSKQRPDVYIKASQIAVADIEECVVFEDSYFAITTAKNAGFSVVGVYDEAEKENWDKVCGITDSQVVF